MLCWCILGAKICRKCYKIGANPNIEICKCFKFRGVGASFSSRRGGLTDFKFTVAAG